MVHCQVVPHGSIDETQGLRTWNRNSVAGKGGPTVPVCRLGGGCVKKDAAHLLKCTQVSIPQHLGTGG